MTTHYLHFEITVRVTDIDTYTNVKFNIQTPQHVRVTLYVGYIFLSMSYIWKNIFVKICKIVLKLVWMENISSEL